MKAINKAEIVSILILLDNALKGIEESGGTKAIFKFQS